MSRPSLEWVLLNKPTDLTQKGLLNSWEKIKSVQFYIRKLGGRAVSEKDASDKCTCLRIGEFNQLGEWLLYAIKSRDLGEECKNTTLQKGG